ncbi:MAG: DUF111 family protein [Candidatus Omnitrophica bacterium]|nr:DUF111 family protein [Candidatus Omnitrophota bacterium]
MLLAGMLALGLPVGEVRRCLRRLGLAGMELRVEKTRVGDAQACRARIRWKRGTSLPREAGRLMRIIRRSALAPSVRKKTARVFSRLAAAEAAVHRVAVSSVHFHQLAEPDTLAVVAGFCAGLERFRVRAVHVTPIPVGAWHRGHRGKWIHRPGPATQRLLQGFPLRHGEGRFEWTTPTAAALLAAFGTPEPAPPMRVERIGRAAGHRPMEGPPLTLLLGYPLG